MPLCKTIDKYFSVFHVYPGIIQHKCFYYTRNCIACALEVYMTNIK